MSDLDRHVQIVVRRLNLQEFLEIAVWCWFGGLVGAVVAGAATLAWPPRVASLQRLAGRWGWSTSALMLAIIALAALGAATGVAVVLAWTRRRSPVDAALAIDHAFGLKERLTTALTLAPEIRDTPIGLAVVTDARRRIERIDCRERFALHLPRRAWLPAVPALALVALCLVNPATTTGSARQRTQQVEAKKDLADTAALIRKRIAERRARARDEHFPEIEKLLNEVEKATERLKDSKTANRETAIVQINAMIDAIKDKQQKLGSAEQMQRQLLRLHQTASGPAEDFKKALSKGDFDQAAKEMDKLLRALAQKDKLTGAQKQELQRQLEQMHKKLDQIANLEKQRDALRKAGLPRDQLRKELAKLDARAQARDLRKLRQLAKQLGQCQQGLKNGDLQKAVDALKQGKADLKQLAQQMKQMNLLDQARADLQDAKDRLGGLDDRLMDLGLADAGPNQGLDGQDMGQENQGKPGPGPGGRGRGFGERPEQKAPYHSYKSRDRTLERKGKVYLQDLVNGPYVKNKSLIEVKQAVEAARDAASDALTKQKIPRNYRDQAKDYFDGLKAD